MKRQYWTNHRYAVEVVCGAPHYHRVLVEPGQLYRRNRLIRAGTGRLVVAHDRLETRVWWRATRWVTHSVAVTPWLELDTLTRIYEKLLSPPDIMSPRHMHDALRSP